MNIDLKPFSILGATCDLSAMLTVLIGIIYFFYCYLHIHPCLYDCVRNSNICNTHMRGCLFCFVADI